jgi:two-component system alkaline phosphatase synthesis response regulator PhoP
VEKKMQDGKHVILVVDDDPDIIEALELVLDANGYGVVKASSAEEGVKVYKNNEPDFVIVDLMMEQVDAGRQFVKELKLLGNKAPVYMLTSVGDQFNQTINPAELGIEGVFQKPVNNENLLKIIKTKLEG